MNITVEFTGTIDSGPYEKTHIFDVETGTTVREFLETLHFHPSHRKFIQVVRQGTRINHTETLNNGDRLELMLMVGGG